VGRNLSVPCGVLPPVDFGWQAGSLVRRIASESERSKRLCIEMEVEGKSLMILCPFCR